jgi:hypothetical protein
MADIIFRGGTIITMSAHNPVPRQCHARATNSRSAPRNRGANVRIVLMIDPAPES